MTMVWSNIIITLVGIGLFLGVITFLVVGFYKIVKSITISEKTLKRIEEKLDLELKNKGNGK